MTLDIENIDHIDWSTYETFDQWSELLKALLVLGRGVSNLNATQKKSLADAFEGFGDHSDVPGEFDRVIQLDNIAYGCATALSKQLISENIQGLNSPVLNMSALSARLIKLRRVPPETRERFDLKS